MMMMHAWTATLDFSHEAVVFGLDVRWYILLLVSRCLINDAAILQCWQFIRVEEAVSLVLEVNGEINIKALKRGQKSSDIPERRTRYLTIHIYVYIC